MFENLSDRLTSLIRKVTGTGRLTADNIQDALREVRVSLLEADVSLEIVKKFIDEVRVKAVGHEVLQNIRPGDAFIKAVYDELVALMGAHSEGLALKTQPPAVVLMAGLQGCGKTTTVAKLAKWLKEKEHKKVAVVSVDVYRPAALLQLQTLAQQIDVPFFPHEGLREPVAIAKEAVAWARLNFIDVLIVDTAGRLHIDEAMMREIKDIHVGVNPIETLLVVDSMMGQDAINTAKVFSESLPLTGIILTKTDGDARGGAALSMRVVTGKPIKFMGSGEKIDALEPFYPDRVASRILGMGDILTLVEEAQQKVDRKHVEKIAKKIQKGTAFDFEDFREQLLQMRALGGLSALLDKLPNIGNLKAAKSMMDDKMIVQMEAIINSMTVQERRFPAVIKGSRKLRISRGCGRPVAEINRLLKTFLQMQKMMKRLKGGGMAKMMASFMG